MRINAEGQRFEIAQRRVLALALILVLSGMSAAATAAGDRAINFEGG